MKRQDDQLCTDLPRLKAEIERLGAGCIVAVLSTTSCFAPRAADDLIGIAKLCQEKDIGHVVNNAYGVQVCIHLPASVIFASRYLPALLGLMTRSSLGRVNSP